MTNAKITLTRWQRHALMSHSSGWIATGFGSGLVPYMQGTFGSLVALIPWLALRKLPLSLYVIVLLASLLLGIWACDKSGKRIHYDDHRSLVWDEFVGQWIALLPVLAGAWWQVLLGFAFFRLFDVAKPWPVGYLDRRLKGGMGVMLDDVVAGLFAAVLLALFMWLLPW